jgi:ABC-2 type transport system ATP-binding protein
MDRKGGETMKDIVEIKGLTKNYFNKRALNGLNLNIEEGKVVGILGPNGSGKTTLIKILTGLLRQTKGEVLIDGHDVGVYTKSIVSYLPDRNFLYNWMTVEDAGGFYKDFYEIGKSYENNISFKRDA